MKSNSNTLEPGLWQPPVLSSSSILQPPSTRCAFIPRKKKNLGTRLKKISFLPLSLELRNLKPRKSGSASASASASAYTPNKSYALLSTQ
jgi:hypothetical protein